MALPITFASLPTGNNPASTLDQNFAAVAAMATTYCTATGTNTLVLTVAPNQPVPTGYANGQRFSFISPSTNTGAVTIQVGSLAAIPVHSGGAPLTANAILSSIISEVVISGNGTNADLVSAGGATGGSIGGPSGSSLPGPLAIQPGTTSSGGACLTLNNATPFTWAVCCDNANEFNITQVSGTGNGAKILIQPPGNFIQQGGNAQFYGPTQIVNTLGVSHTDGIVLDGGIGDAHIVHECSSVAGHHIWYTGISASPDQWQVVDTTVGATRLFIDTSGNVGIPINLNVAGQLTAVTQSPGNNSTLVATTAFVAAAVATGGGAYLPLAGGTLTGALTIAPTAASASLYLNKPAGTSAYGATITAQTAGSNRWVMFFSTNVAETTGNVGSDFTLSRYDNTGTLIDVPLTITRSSGLVTLSQNLTVNGSAQSLGSGAAGLNASWYMNKGTGATTNQLVGQRNSVLRWTVHLGNPTTETGTGNTGSDFQISNFTDAGAAIANPLIIARSSSVCTFAVAIVNGPSDRTLKQDIAPLEDSLEKIQKLQGVSFAFKKTPDKREIGLIAQDVAEVVPEIVQPFNSGEEQGKLGLDYPRLVAHLVEAIKTLSARVEALEARQ